MTDYITVARFKARQGIQMATDDFRIEEHITSASRRIDGVCHRTFGPSTVASARYFTPLDCGTVFIDDAHEITTVAVDDGDNGLYATTWSVTDYETGPANGVGPNSSTGWPVTTLTGVGTRYFPTTTSRRAVKVTAKWGWTAIPDPIIEACYLLTNRLFYEVKVPGGVTAPNLEIGMPGTGLRRPYTAEDLLAPYVRSDRTVGVAG